MDPDASLSMILECIADEAWEDAAGLAEDLLDWLAKGGFAPGGGRIPETSLMSFLKWLLNRPVEGKN